MDGFVHEALPVRIVFGTGARRRVPEELARLGARRALLIAGGSQRAAAADIREALGASCAATLTDVSEHVPRHAVTAAAERARAVRADALVAIGGGSATGLAKAVAVDDQLPVLALPTTYAGSEMTPIYGVTADGHKRIERSLAALPRTVVYDAELTAALPPAITAASGMNAIAHCVEGTWARGATPLTDLLAEEAIRTLSEALPRAVAVPEDLDARESCLWGAALAGMVLAVAGTGVHHRLCHVLGGGFSLSHGGVHAALLPHVVATNGPAHPRAFERLRSALDTDEPAGALFDLAAELGAPTSLGELGLRSDELPTVLEAASDAAAANDPPLQPAELLHLLVGAREGRRPSPVATSVRSATPTRRRPQAMPSPDIEREGVT